MKDSLHAQFGTYNISRYPECIQLIMNSHQALSFRKVKKLKNVKLILAFTQYEALSEVTQQILPTQVDLHYDHIVYFEQRYLNAIKMQTEIEFIEEVFTYRNNNNKEVQRPAPKGLQIKLARQYESLIYQCMQSWFESEQCYWLEES